VKKVKKNDNDDDKDSVVKRNSSPPPRVKGGGEGWEPGKRKDESWRVMEKIFPQKTQGKGGRSNRCGEPLEEDLHEKRV